MFHWKICTFPCFLFSVLFLLLSVKISLASGSTVVKNVNEHEHEDQHNAQELLQIAAHAEEHENECSVFMVKLACKAEGLEP